MDQNLPPNFPSMVIDESLEQVRFEELRDLNRDQDQPMAQDIIAEEIRAQENKCYLKNHLTSTVSKTNRWHRAFLLRSGAQALWEDLMAQGIITEEDEYSERAQEQEIPSGEMPPPNEFEESPDHNRDQDQPVAQRIFVEEDENSEKTQEIHSEEMPHLSDVSDSSSSQQSRLQSQAVFTIDFKRLSDINRHTASRAEGETSSGGLALWEDLVAQGIIVEDDENSEMAQEIRSEEMPHMSDVSDSSSSQPSRLQSQAVFTIDFKRLPDINRHIASRAEGETSSGGLALWEDLVAQGIIVKVRNSF
ncbi:hypothetical protein Bhyg_06711 [Pseudolycoriella hygida]|uniref:Uncharacterized protein n=1 Tax=Pseudolycoriella hygida TaxID=35572 RepID=A0A9Q0N1C8_9DIPT|nr:hypothetical protein Bhyg_06711 [Pseudolycoriella hygida]